MQTPYRKSQDWDLNPGTSSCEATVLPSCGRPWCSYRLIIVSSSCWRCYCWFWAPDVKTRGSLQLVVFEAEDKFGCKTWPLSTAKKTQKQWQGKLASDLDHSAVEEGGLIHRVFSFHHSDSWVLYLGENMNRRHIDGDSWRSWTFLVSISAFICFICIFYTRLTRRLNSRSSFHVLRRPGQDPVFMAFCRNRSGRSKWMKGFDSLSQSRNIRLPGIWHIF